MPDLFDRLDKKKARDLRILRDFVSIFCRETHRAEAKDVFPIKDDRVRQAIRGGELMLCRDCSRLLSHGMAKLMLCPHDPKPMCKKCQTHCYAPGYREKVKQVMRFSGLYLIKHGRLDMLLHYYL